ncbi:MAG TPA: helix-turn-helix transcriptional regulator, partial [Clostridia bacterium]|nr:helix-turn-helix transcriptional regulator [Clostridia bacterium]
MDIGATLRALRLSRNLTQEDLADRCELSKGFISQVENNLTSPSIATLTDMIECLGTTLKQFFSEAP